MLAHIEGYLYQGNQTAAINAAKTDDFDVIVYLGQTIPDSLTHNLKTPVIHIPLYDGENLLNKFLPILENLRYIHNARNPRKTLIACQLGLSRSPAVVMLYYLYYHRYSLDAAQRFVHKKIPYAQINLELIDSIKAFIWNSQ